MKTEHRKTWSEWLSELKRECKRLHYPFHPGVTGEECWRGYYDDDYSPQDALAEDMSYAL